MATEQKSATGTSISQTPAKSNGKRKIKETDKPPVVQSSTSNSHSHSNGTKANSSKSKASEKEQQQVEGSREDDVTEVNGSQDLKQSISSSSILYQIPMNRVSRIIKSEDANIRITQDAVFIINKASEKFLQLFTTEAYASAFLDRKKNIDYKCLSSVVSKRRRFDFLSDFVPEKVKVEDALKESPPAVET